MSTSYADSAQAREWDRRFDAYGQPKKTHAELFHEYDEQRFDERRRIALEERKSLRRRIGLAMKEMEMVCPPVVKP